MTFCLCGRLTDLLLLTWAAIIIGEGHHHARLRAAGQPARPVPLSHVRRLPR